MARPMVSTMSQMREQVGLTSPQGGKHKASKMERMTIDNYGTVKLAPSVPIILFENEKEQSNASKFPVMGNHYKTP